MYKLLSLSFKFIVRKNKCWVVKTTKPTPNSAAENIKKKKVNDKRFMLSYTNPRYNTIPYKVIHNSSAVKSRCIAVFVFISNVLNKRKKKIVNKFKSPKNKIFYIFEVIIFIKLFCKLF